MGPIPPGQALSLALLQHHMAKSPLLLTSLPKARARGPSRHVDYMIASLCKTAMEKNNRQNTELVQKVELAENFKKMSDAMGSKIKASYQCKEFVVLLDKKEKKELKIYTKEQEEDSSKDGSDSEER